MQNLTEKDISRTKNEGDFMSLSSCKVTNCDLEYSSSLDVTNCDFQFIQLAPSDRRCYDSVRSLGEDYI